MSQSSRALRACRLVAGRWIVVAVLTSLLGATATAASATTEPATLDGAYSYTWTRDNGTAGLERYSHHGQPAPRTRGGARMGGHGLAVDCDGTGRVPGAAAVQRVPAGDARWLGDVRRPSVRAALRLVRFHQGGADGARRGGYHDDRHVLRRQPGQPVSGEHVAHGPRLAGAQPTGLPEGPGRDPTRVDRRRLAGPRRDGVRHDHDRLRVHGCLGSRHRRDGDRLAEGHPGEADGRRRRALQHRACGDAGARRFQIATRSGPEDHLLQVVVRRGARGPGVHGAPWRQERRAAHRAPALQRAGDAHGQRWLRRRQGHGAGDGPAAHVPADEVRRPAEAAEAQRLDADRYAARARVSCACSDATSARSTA